MHDPNTRSLPCRLSAFVLCLTILCGCLSIIAVADSAFSQWKTDGWIETAEDGVPVLKSTAGQSVSVLYLNGKAAGNRLSFDVRIDNSFGSVDGNIGAAYKMADGSQYFFEYNTVSKLVRVRRLGADGSDSHVGGGKSYELSLGEWHTMELEFATDHLLWVIDGETVHEITDTGSDSFEDGTLYIQSYFADVTLRDITVDSVSIPLPEAQKCDLEFSEADSVIHFTSDNGSVAWSNGRLIYTLNGEGSNLTSPNISAKQGTVYSMLLPLRNTILVRMSNDTAASQMRLSYITTYDPIYSEDKSLVLDILPYSGDTTYYFNLSACPKLSGYLYGFRLEPIGADSGSIEIEAVTFEREAVITEPVGSLTACTTDGTTITITGQLEAAYAGREVTLYETTPQNYSLTLKDSECLTSVVADGCSFTLTIPYEVDGMTRLSSLFLLGIADADADGTPVRLGERFWVQNGEAYSEGNPYSFTLPDYTVSVLDFGAKGDGFTNDNAAIQAAVDHVHARGGGVVVLPGDDSFYGRRYVATNICLRDNVELRIETGAVLWQSPRVEDYDYDVAIGHDMSIPGVNWAHAGSCHNYPLIYGGEVKNVKVTGGGIIRMQDGGGENADSVSAGTIWTGCENKIHLVPLGFWRCENVEINNVHLRRTNNYHINFRTCENVYLHGVSMWEVTCASGDGISATVGTKNITIDQCFLYTNDDAVTLCSTYNDPRGLAWWHANPDGDNCVDNVVVQHSYLVGGHGITFITWGTDNPNLEMQEIKNVEVFDCVLGGGTYSVGTWPDNPYFGKTPYDGSETNDYSPIKGIRIHDNRYVGMATLECIQGTDIITDCGLHSASQFQYGNFERGLKNKYKDYESGLSNWSFLPTEGKDGQASAERENTNHYGALYGSGTLCQGLWMSKGEHTFTADVRLLSGTASLTVRNAETDELIAEQPITTGNDFETVTLTFRVEKGVNAYLGVTHSGSIDESVHIDNASVTSEEFKRDTWFTESFEDDERLQLINDGFTVADGIADTGSSAAGVRMLASENSYDEFDLHFRTRYDSVNSEIDANLGVSLRRLDSNDQYDIHYDPLRHVLRVREYKNGQLTELCRIDDFDLPVGEWIDMAFRVEKDSGLWYINGEEIATFPMTGVSVGKIALVTYNVSCAYDDVVVAPVGTTRITGNEELPTESDTDPATEPTTELTTEPDQDTEPMTEPTTEADTATESGNGTEATPSETAKTDPDSGCGSALSAVWPVLLLALTVCGVLLIGRRRRGSRA